MRLDFIGNFCRKTKEIRNLKYTGEETVSWGRQRDIRNHILQTAWQHCNPNEKRGYTHNKAELTSPTAVVAVRGSDYTNNKLACGLNSASWCYL
jgi:hypothetical protein